MTGQELRDLVKNSHNSPENIAQYNRIMSFAKMRALEGKFDMFFYEIVSKGVETQLRLDGIKAENIYDKDGNMCKISWES